ncbi:MAG: cytochrome c1 [Gammaproteobacteria bacterium]|nr:cytochrome c1 [Gammaproteobacteria bacterium]
MLWAGLALAWSAATLAAGGGYPLEAAVTDVRQLASLQRGARNFVNYCLGCHSLQYLRYSRVAADLGLSGQELRDNLMFTGTRVDDPMQSAMPPEAARGWFGNAPPDLSLIARSRGLDYVFTYLKSFYVDPARPTGVNNAVLPNTVMPHVLAGLQGLRAPAWETTTDAAGQQHRVLTGLRPASGGTLSAEEFDAFVRDTVNFLDYAAEPAKAQRQALGVLVTLFLVLFTVLAWLLKREYWRDVH